MSTPMAAEQLAAIEERDAETGDGLIRPDYDCAEDRHALLAEVHRLRALVNRPTAGN